ncbi:SH3 domain-containing protein [Acinetobacter baumannii]|uniref:SH3 domain-containing protein n=1 Tax=Acinetobacter baumannii TaxID=470 RepID=UPI00244AFDA7|nr:SH3 domain-containing protein [Acinetobacter baumannii]MDH2531758.1 SH3 domain-containing protein [Acinetobacter baumannii]
MNQNKKIKKNFRIENEPSEEKKDINKINNKLMIESFKNNKELFINLFKLKDLNLSNDLKIWTKIINNTIVKKPLTNDYKIFDELKVLQKNNSYIFKIFDKKEFIDDFIKEFILKDIPYLNGEIIPNDSDLNIFGQMIEKDLKLQDTSSITNNNDNYSDFKKDFLYILFIIICFYIQNLDQFNDSIEAINFFINSVECKGVSVSYVNLRSQPNITSDIIITIPPNSLLKVYEEANNGWVKVQVNINNLDVEGYVSEAYIRRLE